MIEMHSSMRKYLEDSRLSGGVVGGSFPRKKHYEGVWFNVIIVKRGWVRVKFQGKKYYITFE